MATYLLLSIIIGLALTAFLLMHIDNSIIDLHETIKKK